MTAHQANHLKILALRQTSSDLDTKIRDTLVLLTSTRKAILETSSSGAGDEERYDVSYAELLSYARRISKFTLPAGYRGEAADVIDDAETPNAGSGGENTPAVNGGDKDVVMAGMNAGGSGSATPAGDGGVGERPTTELPPEYKRWLDGSADMMFVPWPHEVGIRRGALGGLAGGTEEGGTEISAEEKERRRQEEYDREVKRMWMENREKKENEVKARELGGGAEVEKKGFRLDDFEDEDDD